MNSHPILIAYWLVQTSLHVAGAESLTIAAGNYQQHNVVKYVVTAHYYDAVVWLAWLERTMFISSSSLASAVLMRMLLSSRDSITVSTLDDSSFS